MKMFLWLVLHEAVMTNANRVRRGFTSEAHCAACPDTVEDISHVLFSCRMAQEVWDYFAKAAQGVHDSELGLAEWIK